MILTRAWWIRAGVRALRTALVSAVPFVPTFIESGQWQRGASVIALACILSFATSAASLPELGEGRGALAGLLDRTLRTFAQVVAAGVGTSVLLQDVAWSTLLGAAAASAISTLILAVATGLPETPEEE